MKRVGVFFTQIIGRAQDALRPFLVVFLLGVVMSAITLEAAQAQRTTSKEVSEEYNKAFERYQNDDTAGAAQIIRRLLRSDERSADERTVLLRFLAQLEIDLGNYAEAVRLIEQSFTTGKLNEVETTENYILLGRLYMAVEPPNFAKAIENLNNFIKATPEPKADVYYFLAQAYASTDRFQLAIQNVERAMQLSEKPVEGHYKILLYSYAELKQYNKSVPLLERMMTLFAPKDEYLAQLALGYQELKREKDAFAVQAFRYELGYLDKSSELMGLAQIYMAEGVPNRGARIVEKEMAAGRIEKTEENWEKLGNMWYLSRDYDKALAAFREAAKRSADGELDFRIGQTCFEQEDWRCSQTYFQNAIRKGGFKNVGSAWLLLGHTRQNLGNSTGALAAFREARKFDEAKRDADQWIAYIENILKQDEIVKIIDTMREIEALNDKALLRISDDDLVAAIAQEALDAATAAREATDPQERAAKIAEYERAARNVRAQLDEGMLSEAKAGREEALKVIERARSYDLEDREANVVDSFDTLSLRRVQSLERAEALLEEAAQIAAEARQRT